MLITRSKSNFSEQASFKQSEDIDNKFALRVEIPFTDKAGKKTDSMAVALLDTQCPRGDWISHNLLGRIRKTHEISETSEKITVKGVIGPVDAWGKITINMRLRNGNRYHRLHFSTFPPGTGLEFDIILGVSTLLKYDPVTVTRNHDAMLPLFVSEEPSAGE